MIFPVIKTDDIAQVDDKLRIDVRKTYIASGTATIAKVEIEPEDSAGFVDVYDGDDRELWYLDWQYATAGTKVITLKITDDGDVEKEVTFSVEVLTAADDKLYSSDNDLFSWEPSLLEEIPSSRTSYKFWHRQAQKNILDFLNNNGYTNSDGDRFAKVNIVDILEVKDWATFNVLKMLFSGDSNSKEDVFVDKSSLYRDKEVLAREKAILRIDQDGDGTANSSISFFSGTLSRK
jgi:hypothetical protein